MKKILQGIAVVTLAFAVCLGGVASVSANSGKSNSKTHAVKAKKIEMSQKRVVSRLSSVQKTNAGLHLKIKGSRKTIPGRITALNSITVTDATTGTSTVTFQGFTMKKGGSSITVLVDANTVYKDRKGAAITADKLLVGHKVSVKGQYMEGSRTQILAKSVRDITLPIETETTETE